MNAITRGQVAKRKRRIQYRLRDIHVMASLAWTLKAWLALLLPAKDRWKARHQAEKQTVLRMEFKTFLNAFMRVPCQIVRTGRRIVYRLLSWNRWQHVFFRAVAALRLPLRC